MALAHTLAAIPFLFLASPAGERIAFSCVTRVVNDVIPDKTAIFTMNADGTNLVQLTSEAGHDEFPAWSPDGSRIVFESDRGGKKTLYVMNADGSNLKPLLPSPGADCPINQPCRARWSPDGTQIAFSRRGSSDRIHVVRPDGSSLRPLSRPDDQEGSEHEPTWSPDGRRIAYLGNGIVIADVETGARAPLPGRFWARTLQWSPDGRQFVFEYSGNNGGEVRVVNVDGRLTPSMDQINLLALGNWISEPAWSPDGRRIIYSRHSGFSNRNDLWVMDADGSNKKQLLKGRFKGSYAQGPAWVKPVSR